MRKIDWVRKLTSRKLWTAVASFVSMMILATGGTDNTATQVTALIMAGASVVAYIIFSETCLLHLLDAECRLLRCLLCVDRITEMIYSLDFDAVLSAAFHILAELCVYRLCVSFTKDCELDAVCCYSGKVYIALPI